MFHAARRQGKRLAISEQSNIKSSRRELFIILRPQIIYGDQRDAATMAAMREGFTEVGKLLDAAGL